VAQRIHAWQDQQFKVTQMKNLSFTSLICGTILILAPFVHNILSVAIVAYVLANRPEKDVDLHGALSDAYPNLCLFVGACLILAGFVAGVRTARAGQAAAPALLGTPRGSTGA
jgi:hypothetical protein